VAIQLEEGELASLAVETATAPMRIAERPPRWWRLAAAEPAGTCGR